MPGGSRWCGLSHITRKFLQEISWSTQLWPTWSPRGYSESSRKPISSRCALTEHGVRRASTDIVTWGKCPATLWSPRRPRTSKRGRSIRNFWPKWSNCSVHRPQPIATRSEIPPYGRLMISAATLAVIRAVISTLNLSVNSQHLNYFSQRPATDPSTTYCFRMTQSTLR